MNRRRKIALGLIAALMLAIYIVFVGGFSVWGRLAMSVMRRQARQGRVTLLCETDHKVLLESCRELSKRAANGTLKPGEYVFRGSHRSPEVSSFPQAILDIAPVYVYIDENDSGRIMVAMSGGLDHFEVTAYTEDYKNRFGSKLGDKELLPWLWYYDDNYKRRPNYDKEVDILLQRKP